MTSTVTPPTAMLYTSEERESGKLVRSIFLKIFGTWKPAEFARIIASNIAYDPVHLWHQLLSNPVTRIAGNIIKSRIKPENAARIFTGFTTEEVIIQIRDNRADLYDLAQSPAGRHWIQYYLNGFKQCICPHTGYIVFEGNTVHCTLCGKVTTQ